MTGRLGRCVVVSILAVAGATISAPAHGDDGPPPAAASTLTGETLFGELVIFRSGSCNETGGTASFEVVGRAFGPYTGSFIESGTFTYGPTLVGGGHEVLDFEASFTIRTSDATVVGTKQFSGAGTFSCEPGSSFFVAVTTATYEATITTSQGTFSDSGTADVEVGTLEVFKETFVSSQVAPVPLETPGLATGGGQVSEDVTFGFTAKSDASGPRGTCNVVAIAADVHVRCLDVTSYVQVGTRATFKGRALVNGVPTEYQIDVDDISESGIGQDTFTIVAGSFAAGGLLTEGNIQVHP